MTNAARLAQNAAFCVRCARQMRREIQARLDYGDTNHISIMLERLARGAFFPDTQALLNFLEICDASMFCDFVLTGCGTKRLSQTLETVTGKSRAVWLGLMANKPSWELCPPLHNVQGQLRITHS